MVAPDLVVGTRGSALALAQTTLVCDAIRRIHPALRIQVERITTSGDVRTDVPLSQLDRGMFVAEIEHALRDRRITVAVHSAKDLPSTIARDLRIVAFPRRADARDVLVSRDGSTLASLAPGARVGTSSPRRACQLRAARPDLDVRDVRGNVDTRLRKLRAGEYDALLLAGAGLARLGREHEATEWLGTDQFVPCVGQGALAIEARVDDHDVHALLQPLDDPDTRAAVTAERGFLAELGAGCRAAVAAHADMQPTGALRIVAMMGRTDGVAVRTSRSDRPERARDLGIAVAHELLRDGGAEFLAQPNGPLHGRTVALTRALGQSSELSALLRASGARVLGVPAIAVRTVTDTALLDAELRNLAAYDWIVVTSANAVHALAERGAAIGAAIPATVKLAAVGGSTAETLRARVRPVDFIPSHGDARTLAEQLPVSPGASVLFPRGSRASDTLGTVLAARGVAVRDVVAYETVRGAGLDELVAAVTRGDVDVITFTAPSAVQFVTEALDAAGTAIEARPLAVSIGPSSSAALGAAGWRRVTEAAAPSVGAMLEALQRALTVHGLPALTRP